MTIFDNVSKEALGVLSMSSDDAALLKLRLMGEAPSSIIEVCQNASSLSLILAAILEDQGFGTLTTFQNAQSAVRSSFEKKLSDFGLKERATILPSGRSYTWAMKRLIEQSPRPSFDVCVLNGSKKWDAITGTFLLADMLLRSGGLIVLPDRDWSMAASPYFRDRPQVTQSYSEDELNSHPVKLVTDLVAPQLGYREIELPYGTSFALLRRP